MMLAFLLLKVNSTCGSNLARRQTTRTVLFNYPTAMGVSSGPKWFPSLWKCEALPREPLWSPTPFSMPSSSPTPWLFISNAKWKFVAMDVQTIARVLPVTPPENRKSLLTWIAMQQLQVIAEFSHHLLQYPKLGKSSQVQQQSHLIAFTPYLGLASWTRNFFKNLKSHIVPHMFTVDCRFKAQIFLLKI